MILKLAISPCPNDTFMFDALVNKRIDGGGLQFETNYQDIEELNGLVAMQIPDVSKISVAAYPAISEFYQILDAGAAMGNSNGPILVSKKPYTIDQINDLSIAIPGIRTTANLLLNIAFPNAQKKEEVLFSKIEELVLQEKYDAGLIIHESRFTFQSKGLYKIVDLGEYWEQSYKMPIALGCIVVRRSLPDQIKDLINRKIAESVKYAFDYKEQSKPYIKCYSQELADEVIEQHIALYVNKYSVSLGDTGRDAIEFLFEKSNLPNRIMDKRNIFLV